MPSKSLRLGFGGGMNVPLSFAPPPPPPDYESALQDPTNWSIFANFFGTQCNVSSATVDGRSNAVLFTVPSNPSPHDYRVIGYGSNTFTEDGYYKFSFDLYVHSAGFTREEMQFFDGFFLSSATDNPDFHDYPFDDDSDLIWRDGITVDANSNGTFTATTDQWQTYEFHLNVDSGSNYFGFDMILGPPIATGETIHTGDLLAFDNFNIVRVGLKK